MQRKSLGKQIWEVISPILLYFGVTVLVEFIWIAWYYINDLPQLIEAMKTEEALIEYVGNMVYRVSAHAVEITAVSAAAALPFLIWMKARDAKKEREAGIFPAPDVPPAKYLLVAGISIPLSIGLNNLLTLSSLAEYSEAYQEAEKVLYTPSLPVQLLCLGILIPITEEYIFRGLVFRRIRQTVSAGRAIVLSALIFGLYHGNSVQLLYGGVCGLLLAYLYERYGSMKAPILAHILMNMTSCILTAVNGYQWVFANPLRVVLVTVACAAAASTVFLFIRDVGQKSAKKDAEEKETYF